MQGWLGSSSPAGTPAADYSRGEPVAQTGRAGCTWRGKQFSKPPPPPLIPDPRAALAGLGELGEPAGWFCRLTHEPREIWFKVMLATLEGALGRTSARPGQVLQMEGAL